MTRILRVVIGMIVGIWMARYLGPDQFGTWNYSLAFCSVFIAFATVGLESIVVRDLVRFPEITEALLGTAFVIKLVASFTAFVVALLVVILLNPGGEYTTALVALIMASAIFQAFQVVTFYFQSQTQARYVVYATNAAFLAGSGMKIYLLSQGYPLIYFALVLLVESILTALLLVVSYQVRGWRVLNWKIDFTLAVRLYQESWPLMLAYVAYVSYTRVDQIMLGQMLDKHAVGLYSVAYQVYEVPFFFLLACTQSVFPYLSGLFHDNRQKYFRRYGQLTFFSTLLGYLLVGLIYFFGAAIVSELFGEKYSGSAEVLIILTLGHIVLFNGFLRSGYLTVADGQRIILLTTVFSAVLNIALNYLLIPAYGMSGAAISTVLTQFVSLFLLNYFFSGARSIFKIQLKCLFLIPALSYFRVEKNVSALS